MKTPKRLGKIMVTIIGTFVVTSIIAVFVGFASTYFVKLVNPEDGEKIKQALEQDVGNDETSGEEKEDEPTIAERTVNLLTVNDFSKLLSKDNIIALLIFSIIFGIVFIAMGVLKLIEYFTSETKEDYLLSIALIAVVFGVIVLFASDSIISLFRIILGVWIIAAGIMDFQTTLIWKEVKSVYWTLALLFSMLMIIAGIVILVNANILFTTIGVLTIIYVSFSSIVLLIRLYSLGR